LKIQVKKCGRKSAVKRLRKGGLKAEEEEEEDPS
jgi:hypothetical protein